MAGKKLEASPAGIQHFDRLEQLAAAFPDLADHARQIDPVELLPGERLAGYEVHVFSGGPGEIGRFETAIVSRLTKSADGPLATSGRVVRLGGRFENFHALLRLAEDRQRPPYAVAAAEAAARLAIHSAHRVAIAEARWRPLLERHEDLSFAADEIVRAIDAAYQAGRDMREAEIAADFEHRAGGPGLGGRATKERTDKEKVAQMKMLKELAPEVFEQRLPTGTEAWTIALAADRFFAAWNAKPGEKLAAPRSSDVIKARLKEAIRGGASWIVDVKNAAWSPRAKDLK